MSQDLTAFFQLYWLTTRHLKVASRCRANAQVSFMNINIYKVAANTRSSHCWGERPNRLIFCSLGLMVILQNFIPMIPRQGSLFNSIILYICTNTLPTVFAGWRTCRNSSIDAHMPSSVSHDAPRGCPHSLVPTALRVYEYIMGPPQI